MKVHPCSRRSRSSLDSSWSPPKNQDKPRQKECRRSLQLDLAYDIFGGFSQNFCQLGIAGPIGHGPFYLLQNLRRVFYPMLFAQCLKLGRAGIPSLAHDEHALLAARAIGKDQVVGGRETP